MQVTSGWGRDVRVRVEVGCGVSIARNKGKAEFKRE